MPQSWIEGSMKSKKARLASVLNIPYKVNKHKFCICCELTAICGGWGSWNEWSLCSAICGPGGYTNRKRYCDTPAPLYGGTPCEGEGVESKPCVGPNCRKNRTLLQLSYSISTLKVILKRLHFLISSEIISPFDI